MNRIVLPLVLLCLWTPAVQADPGSHGVGGIHHDRAARWDNANRSWHAPFAHAQWGRPVALIVPPTVNFQTDYSWGVARTRMTPINHQFARPYPNARWGQRWAPHPPWPGDTRQMGVYYVRGPW